MTGEYREIPLEGKLASMREMWRVHDFSFHGLRISGSNACK